MIICLTGGIASGKSTAVKYLAGKGAHIIDADVLGHRAYDPGTRAHAEVIATFGEDVRADDGQIDRKVLGGKVFGKPDALKQLTDIVWPEIRRLAEAEIQQVQASDANPIIVLEAAVLPFVQRTKTSSHGCLIPPTGAWLNVKSSNDEGCSTRNWQSASGIWT